MVYLCAPGGKVVIIMLRGSINLVEVATKM